MAKKSTRRTYRRSKRRSASQSVQDSYQSKMKLGEPGDVLEKEADRMADNVVNKPQNKQQPVATANMGAMGQTKKEEDKKEDMAQAKGEAGASTVASPVAKAVYQSKGQGQKMPAKTQHFMENRFGADFSQVNIHTDQKSVWMSQQLKAQAFTHGRDVYFNEGKFDPSSRPGKHLLAHELTHVVQQGKARPMLRKQASGAAPAPAAAPGATAPTPAPAAPTATVTIAKVNADSTPVGMADRIPPRKNTKVKVVVSGLKKGQPAIELSIKNGGAANGNATINGTATHQLKKSAVVKLKGTTQTAPGNGGKLQLEAKQGGNLLGSSNRFSVAAIPEFWGGSLGSKISTGPTRGVVVNDKWKSDSGQVGDLNQVWISEEVQTNSASGIYAGSPVSASGYLGPSTVFTEDVLEDPINIMTGKGKVVDHQASIFWDKRTGSKDISLKKSAYKITARVGKRGKGKFWHQVTRRGANVSANGHSSKAGAGLIDSGKQNV